MIEAARSLRTGERYLINPPIKAEFGSLPVLIADISGNGARFRHDPKLETGTKELMRIRLEGRATPVAFEALVIWSQPDSADPATHISGARIYGRSGIVDLLIHHMLETRRAQRIEELRGTDRFVVVPPLDASFGGVAAHIDDLSARGLRMSGEVPFAIGKRAKVWFHVPESDLDISVEARAVWSGVKSVDGSSRRYQSGMAAEEKPELLRLAIGQLAQNNRATLDTKSLALKLKIMRARARQLAPSYRTIETSGISAEQYLLIQGVREELRLNPEEAFHWYRRARLMIKDPTTRTAAPPIADHPDALAVWEYLDRTVDASIVGRAFDLQ